MRCLGMFVACAALLMPQPALADVRIRLQFDGAPFVSRAKPELSCLDDAKQQWFACGLTPTGAPGEFRRPNLAPGSYVILGGANENRANGKNLPGDWHVDYRFNIAAGRADQVIEVPMARLIHLVKPQSNDGPIAGTLAPGCKTRPLFVPPGTPGTHELAIPFEWEPVIPGATYKVTVMRKDCGSRQERGVLQELETAASGVSMVLPPNAEDEYYAFFIFARKDGRVVGNFLTYDAGIQSWHYGFRIAPAVTPASYYIAAGVLLLAAALLWLGLGRAGLGLVPRALVLAALGAGFVVGKRELPHADALPPWKYFVVPAIFPANEALPQDTPAEGRVPASARDKGHASPAPPAPKGGRRSERIVESRIE